MKKTIMMTFMILIGAAIFVLPCFAEDMIYGCYRKYKGQLRVVKNPSQCSRWEVPIYWNQIGPPGPQGPQGEKGEPGADADLSQVMQANRGNVLVTSGSLTQGFGPYDLLDVPHFGPVNFGCDDGVASVKLTISPQTYRQVWTTVDGGAPTYTVGDFATPEEVVAQGANTAGAHVTTFRATHWNGNEEWLAEINVASTDPTATGACSYMIWATLVRHWP